MRIHSVISEIHLEQAKEDPFERNEPRATQIEPDPIRVDGHDEYVVEKLLRSEKRAALNAGSLNAAETRALKDANWQWTRECEAYIRATNKHGLRHRPSGPDEIGKL